MPRHTAETLMLLRKRMGLDQEQFGNLIGVTRAYVSRLENGHFPISPVVSEKLDALQAGHKSDMKKEGDTSSLRETEPARYGTGNITRAQIEAQLRTFLDAAERVPGGLGWASVQISMHLRPEQLQALTPGYDPLVELRKRVAALQGNQGGASQQRAS